MSIGEVSFYTGILLFLIGIIGGGVDIKEVKIPEIKGAPRYMCFIGSLLFLVMGLYLKKEITLPTVSNPTTATIATPQVTNTPDTKAPDVPATTPVVPAQPAQAVTQPVTPPENTASDANKSLVAKQQALIKLDEANKRINSVWNGTTPEIRYTLLPEQQQWLKERENDCSLQAESEQPVDTVMQEAVKLTCMTAMTDPRIEALKQEIAQSASPETPEAVESTPPETETPKNQDIRSIATLSPSVSSASINDAQKDKALEAKQQAQMQLDEANKRINIVWNATTKAIREDLLPEQRQWLKKREHDCRIEANKEPNVNMQDAVKLGCMAAMTDPRTQELEQEIADMSQ
jgi:uncharacterized protein YecT (DUF1311 family)